MESNNEILVSIRNRFPLLWSDEAKVVLTISDENILFSYNQDPINLTYLIRGENIVRDYINGPEYQRLNILRDIKLRFPLFNVKECGEVFSNQFILYTYLFYYLLHIINRNYRKKYLFELIKLIM